MASSGVTFTVAAGQTVSDGLAVPRGEIVGFVMPAALVSTTMTFQVSLDDSTYVALNNDTGSAISLTVAASKAVSLKADLRSQLTGWPFMKVVMGSTETNGAAVKIVRR